MRSLSVLTISLFLCACGESTPTSASADAKSSGSATAKSSAKANAAPSGSASAAAAPPSSAKASAAEDAPAAPSGSAAAAAAVPTPFEFSYKGLKISIPVDKDKWAVMTVKDDGTIVTGDTTLGKVTGNEMHDEKDKVKVTLAKDGSLTNREGKDPVYFNDKDELIMPKGGRVALEGGLVKSYKPDGSLHDPDGMPKLEGATDKNSKRTGMIIALVFSEECAKADEAAAKKKK